MRRMLVRAATLVALSTAVATTASAQNLLQNGGFEAGNLSSWTLGGNTGFTGVDCNVGTQHTGNCAGHFGAVGSDGTMGQSFGDNAGDQLTFSFFLQNNGGSPNDFFAAFNGTQLASLTNAGAFGYTQYSYNVTATGSDAVTFGFRQDPSYFHLDDVSVVATPTTTPEPSSMALLGTGLVGLIPMIRRRRKQPRTTAAI